jgi:hypothetical protein
LKKELLNKHFFDGVLSFAAAALAVVGAFLEVTTTASTGMCLRGLPTFLLTLFTLPDITSTLFLFRLKIISYQCEKIFVKIRRNSSKDPYLHGESNGLTGNISTAPAAAT